MDLALQRSPLEPTLATTTDARTRTSFGELDTWTGSVSGTPVYSYDLDRDAAGRSTRKTETIGGETVVWDYSYHPQRGWLTGVSMDSVVVASYVYDDNGNRTSVTDFWGSSTSTYDDQDRQLTAGLVGYTHTANGERLTKTAGVDVTSYDYDVRGALLSVDLPNGIEIDYVVDASGRRIGKKVDDVLTKGWIYAGGLAPVAQTDGTGSITQSYVYATKGNVPDFLIAGGVAYRLFTDHLGSVRLVINTTTGAIAQRIDYDAWGRITLDTNPGFQPFGFAGGLYDHQTGLVRFGARDYDPETGRWTAKDPIGFAGGSSLLFDYCRSEPVNCIDPTGRYGQDVHLVRTFVWALEEGVPVDDSLAIATSNQGMDRPIVDVPPNLHNPFNLQTWWLRIGTIEHFQGDDQIDRDLESAVQGNDAAAFGRALHALQDSFSHRGFRWWSGGHVPHSLLMRLLGRRDTDEYHPDTARDRAMEDVTRAWLWRWANRTRDQETQQPPDDGIDTYLGVLFVEE